MRPTFAWVRRILLPLLLAGFEAAWVYPWLVLLGYDPAGGRPLLPGWAVFVLIALPAVLPRVLLDRGWPLERTRAVVLLVGTVVGLAVLWAHYFTSVPVLESRWLTGMFREVATGVRIPPAGVAGLVGIYLWARGLLTANKVPTFSETWRAFAWGVLMTAVLVVLAAAYRAAPAWQSVARDGFPAIVAFLFVGFVAIALARLTEVWEETRVRGEPPVLSRHWLAVMLAVVTAMVAASLILSALVGFNLAALLMVLLRPVARLGEWLLAALFWILEPIIAVTVAFVADLFASFRGRRVPSLDRTADLLQRLRREGLSLDRTSPQTAATIRLATEIGGLLVVLAILLFLLSRARRRGERPADEERESVFSAREVLQKAAAAIRGLGRRAAGEAITGPPEVVAVRRIYRELLRLTEQAGWPRSPQQTPYEYLGVLAPTLPGVRDDLLGLTETYVRARYGPSGVDGGEVEEARRSLDRVRVALAAGPAEAF